MMGLASTKGAPALSMSSAFRFVVMLGIVNLFADMTYEGASSINGPFLGMLGASAAVFCFSYDSLTVGASGAIFGLFGALVAIGLRLGPRGRSLIMQTLPVIGINLVFTFSVPTISKAGHVGGLIVGFLAALAIVRLPSARQYLASEEEEQDYAGAEPGGVEGEQVRAPAHDEP